MRFIIDILNCAFLNSVKHQQYKRLRHFKKCHNLTKKIIHKVFHRRKKSNNKISLRSFDGVLSQLKNDI